MLTVFSIPGPLAVYICLSYRLGGDTGSVVSKSPEDFLLVWVR